MCNTLLKNFWLDRVERRKKDQVKQTKVNGILDSIAKRIKLAAKDKGKKSGK